MSSFTEPLAYCSTDIFAGGRLSPIGIGDEYELTGGRRMFKLSQGFAYTCGRTLHTFLAPAGFLCDLGSIPGLARFAMSPDDPWAQAFVLHDLLYRSKPVDRATADLIFWDALGLPFRAYGEDDELYRILCPKVYRSAIYYAVRLAGAKAWAK